MRLFSTNITRCSEKTYNLLFDESVRHVRPIFMCRKPEQKQGDWIKLQLISA